MEGAFEESRARLGVETQRQWSDTGIARLKPVLFGLFSVVRLLADALIKEVTRVVRTASWYAKAQPIFSDTLA